MHTRASMLGSLHTWEPIWNISRRRLLAWRACQQCLLFELLAEFVCNGTDRSTRVFRCRLTLSGCMNPPLESTSPPCSSLPAAWTLCWCCFSGGGGDGWRGGGVSAPCFVVALAKAPCTVDRKPTSTHSDHAFRMATDMVALIAGLYVGHSLLRVLESTFAAHLAVASLPVPANRHCRWPAVDDSSTSLRFDLWLLGNAIRWMSVDWRFGGVVCTGESKQDKRWV